MSERPVLYEFWASTITTRVRRRVVADVVRDPRALLVVVRDDAEEEPAPRAVGRQARPRRGPETYAEPAATERRGRDLDLLAPGRADHAEHLRVRREPLGDLDRLRGVRQLRVALDEPELGPVRPL